MWEHALPDPLPLHATAGLLLIVELQAVCSVWGKSREPAASRGPGGSSPVQLHCQRPITPGGASSRSIMFLVVAPEHQTSTHHRKSMHRQGAQRPDRVALPPQCQETSVAHCQLLLGLPDAHWRGTGTEFGVVAPLWHQAGAAPRGQIGGPPGWPSAS
jgi:hypothetical protein